MLMMGTLILSIFSKSQNSSIIYMSDQMTQGKHKEM